MSNDPRRHLPLKPVDLELLLALAHEERHGYGLVQEISANTNGLIALDPGNLYRVIKRVVDAGLVAESAHRVAPELANERRRYYKITALGTKVLGAELQRLQSLVSSASARSFVRRLAT